MLDFIVEWNNTMELLNGKPLSREERSQTAELTDEKANSMTLEEYEDYLRTREELLIRDYVSSDSTVRSITRNLLNQVQGLVDNDGQYKALSQIGLSTGEVGAGPDAASVSLGRLIAPTSDRETLSTLLEANADLMDAINNNSDELYDLFAGMLTSRITHQGSRDLSSGMTVSGELRFTIGDGNNEAEIVFNSGSYSQTQILNTVNQQLLRAGLSNSMFAYYDSLNQLNLRVGTEGTQAYLQIFDQSVGAASLISALGWQSGNFTGPDPAVSGGIARRSRDYINNITTTGGIVMERIRQGGTYDRRLETYNETIERMERSLADYEDRLRQKFARLETNLAQLQQQQQAAAGAIAKMNGSSSSSSSSSSG
jgi:flagellar capping protein FliD